MKRKILAIGFVISLVFSYCLSGLQQPPAQAEESTTTDYDQQIRQAEEEKKKAESRLESLEKDLKELEDSKGDILKYIKKVDKKIEKISDTISGLKKQIETSRKELAKIQEQCSDMQKKQKEQYEIMKKRIKYMYENGEDGYVEAIFSAASFADFLSRSEYVQKISEYDANIFKEYSERMTEIEHTQSLMEAKVDEICSLQDEAVTDQSSLKKLKTSKKDEVKKLNSAISVTDKRVQTYNAEVAKQEQKVEALLLQKQQEIQKKEAEAAKKSQQSAKASGGNTSTDGADPASSNDSYAANTGELRWPLKVSGRISSKFGSRTSPTAGASTYHKGIDISVSSGTAIVASGAGTVVTATYSSTAGNYIMIYHGNSLYTVYMHCSKLGVKVGDTVNQGDVIGNVGSTGISTGPHLHFGVTVNGSYVNPLNYVSQ